MVYNLLVTYFANTLLQGAPSFYFAYSVFHITEAFILGVIPFIHHFSVLLRMVYERRNV